MLKNLTRKGKLKTIENNDNKSENISPEGIIATDWKKMQYIGVLQQYSTKEFLEKTMEKGPLSESQFLDDGEPVAILIIIPLKGCIFTEKLGKYEDGEGVYHRVYGPKPKKIYLVMILGIAEFVEYLELNMLFTAPIATKENFICDEQIFEYILNGPP